MKIKIKFEKYVPIPEGIYPGRILSVEEDANSQYGPQLKIRFTLEDVPGYEDDKELSTWCSAKFSPKSKLFKWTEKILGKIPDGYDFDSDDILNKKVLVLVGRKIGSDGQEYDRIEDIKPLRIQSATHKTLEDVNQDLEAFEAVIPE